MPGMTRKAKAKAKQAAQQALTSLVDLKQAPVKVSNKVSAPWYPGQVNIFIQNTLDEPVRLRCDRKLEDICKDLQEGQEGHAIAPGDGTSVMSFDTDSFEAFTTGSDGCEITPFLRHLILHTEHLPRQARDTHIRKTPKEEAFFAGSEWLASVWMSPAG